MSLWLAMALLVGPVSPPDLASGCRLPVCQVVRTRRAAEGSERAGAAWCKLARDYHGISAEDPRWRDLGTWKDSGEVPGAADGLHDWFANRKKASVCGQLKDFGDNCARLGDLMLVGECDLNNFLEPAEPWKLLTTFYACDDDRNKPWVMVRPRRSDDEGAPCHEHGIKSGNIEIEITPPKELRKFLRDEKQEERPFCPWRPGTHWWEGSNQTAGGWICAYGPWVLDMGHGNHPEIHPAQMTWWNAGAQKADPWCESLEGAGRYEYGVGPVYEEGPYYLIVAQDASGRFNREHGFLLDGAPDDSWYRPWAAGPVHAEFRIAVSFREGDAFVLESIPSQRDSPGPSTRTATWTAKASGVTLLSVENRSGNPFCQESDARSRQDRGSQSAGSERCVSIHLARLPQDTKAPDQGKDDEAAPDHVLREGDTHRATLVLTTSTGSAEPWDEGSLVLRLRRLSAPKATAQNRGVCEETPPSPAGAAQREPHQVTLTWKAKEADWESLAGAKTSELPDQRMWEDVVAAVWSDELKHLAPTTPPPLSKWQVARRIKLFASVIQRPARMTEEDKLAARKGFSWLGLSCFAGLEAKPEAARRCKPSPERGASTTVELEPWDGRIQFLQVPVPDSPDGGGTAGQPAARLWRDRYNPDTAQPVIEWLKQICGKKWRKTADVPTVTPTAILLSDLAKRLGPPYTIDELRFLVSRAATACPDIKTDE